MGLVQIESGTTSCMWQSEDVGEEQMNMNMEVELCIVQKGGSYQNSAASW